MKLEDRWKKDAVENSAPCSECKKHIKFTKTCKAYPDEIPDKILEAERKCKYFEAKTG